MLNVKKYAEQDKTNDWYWALDDHIEVFPDPQAHPTKGQADNARQYVDDYGIVVVSSVRQYAQTATSKFCKETNAPIDLVHVPCH